jgi:hypothetical protein
MGIERRATSNRGLDLVFEPGLLFATFSDEAGEGLERDLTADTDRAPHGREQRAATNAESKQQILPMADGVLKPL